MKNILLFYIIMAGWSDLLSEQAESFSFDWLAWLI
jgi:hypothetical protein